MTTTVKHRGPHPAITAIVYAILFLLSLVLYFALSGGAAYPLPFGDTSEARELFLKNPHAILANGFFLFGSAFPLGLFTAAVTSRLSFLGVKATGVSIALFGGIAAAVFTAISGLSTWVLAQPGVATNKDLLHAIQLFGFVNGGVGYAVGIGLLMAGVSVPCLILGLTPRWVAWQGLVIGGIAVLSTLSLVFFPLTILLPVARFGSLAWMIAVGFTLVKTAPDLSNRPA